MRLGIAAIIERLQSGAAQHAPLSLVCIETEPGGSGGDRADAIVEFRVADGPSFRALVEVLSPASPKRVTEACLQIQHLIECSDDPGLVPLVVAPYIGEKQAATLRRAGVSWLDLSGNMVIRVGEQIYIERTGRPNQFPDSSAIKNVFQGTASLVARTLLLQRCGFGSLAEVVDFVGQRGGTVALSTVSKVLRSLEEDLLISKTGSCIHVLDRDQLLDRLATGYASSSWRARATVRRFVLDDAPSILRQLGLSTESPYVCCGFSAAQLKGLAVDEQISLYVGDMMRFGERIGRIGPALQPDEEFGNLRVIETRSRLPWFNSETIDGMRVVDDIQLYLDMTVDTPRGPKVAEVLRQRILAEATDG